MMRTVVWILTGLLASGANAADPLFTQAPVLQRDGTRFTIRFALAEAADVELSVQDTQGNTLRHLAAGWVGGAKAAEPFRAGALAQRIAWDGRDDDGKRVEQPARIRVRAGLQARFGRYIGGSPYRGRATSAPYRGSLQGVAVDGRGHLFVKMMSDVGSHGNSGLWPWQVREFDPDGTYIKTLLPYAADTPPERASGYELIDEKAGPFTPVNQNSLYPVFSTFGSTLYPHILPGGELLFLNSRKRRLTFFKTDGSNRLREVELWPADAKMPAPKWLNFEIAFSPDRRYVYYANVAGTVYDGKAPGDVHPDWPNGRVYRQDLQRPGSAPEPFFDLALPDFDKTPYWMPSAWDKRTAAAAVATDPDGRVYICDQVNQQVVIVSPAGKQLDAISLPWPDRVQVHPRTRDLYVVSRKVTRGTTYLNTLLKVSRRGGKAAVVAEFPLRLRGDIEFTVDARRNPAVLWVLAPGKNTSGQSLLRIEDRADGFVVSKDAFDRDHHAISFCGNLAVDRGVQQVYVTDTRGQAFSYHGLSGAGGPIDLTSTLLTADQQGGLIGVSGWHSPLARFNRRFEPVPVGESDTHTFSHFYGRAGRGSSLGGLTVDRKGRIWTLAEGTGMFVRAYEADGTPVPGRYAHVPKRDQPPVQAFVDIPDIHASCVRVDARGNIYVGWLELPEDHVMPKGFEKDEAYRRATGSILRFGPKGGRWLKKSRHEKAPEGSVMGFEGVEAVYPGLAPFSRWRCDGSCVCTKPRFDVDDFGRLYVPNAITYTVSILDPAGNTVARFGQYGNYDAGAVPGTSIIPLGWPTNAARAGDHVYIADVLNHRVVRVDLSYRSEIKLPLTN